VPRTGTAGGAAAVLAMSNAKAQHAEPQRA
jgi:hypothetical protein